MIGVQHRNGTSGRFDHRAEEDQKASKDDILGFMQGKIAKWWMPDDVAFARKSRTPRPARFLKTELRERFKSYRLPTAAA